MAGNRVGGFEQLLLASLISLGVSKDLSEMVVVQLNNLVGATYRSCQTKDVFSTLRWLDWLKHRSDCFEEVKFAILLREISRVGFRDLSRRNSPVLEVVKRVRLPKGHKNIVEHLFALPEPDTFWLPATTDETLLLDVERSWFGSSWCEYQRRAAILQVLDSSVDWKRLLVQRKNNLIRIFNSGLIYFLPETRSSIEGRAFLNMSFEISDIKKLEL